MMSEWNFHLWLAFYLSEREDFSFPFCELGSIAWPRRYNVRGTIDFEASESWSQPKPTNCSLSLCITNLEDEAPVSIVERCITANIMAVGTVYEWIKSNQ